MIYNYKRDIVEEAQEVMNANKSMDNKNLISSLSNEIITLRAEIERLEKRNMMHSKGVKSLTVSFDANGIVDGVQSERYGE